MSKNVYSFLTFCFRLVQGKIDLFYHICCREIFFLHFYREFRLSIYIYIKLFHDRIIIAQPKPLEQDVCNFEE